jgi:thiamine transport system permease protein
MSEERSSRDFGLPRTVAIIVFVILIAYPFSRILQRADFGGAMPAELWPTAFVSVEQAGGSLLASLALGVPLGVLYAGAWSRWLRGFSIASFSLPGLFIVGMMSEIFRGTEFRFGLATVVAAHAFLNAPWIALATAEGIRSVPRAWVDAARTLGATRLRAFVRIELPWIGRRVALASAQVFALCLMSFAIVLILGGGPPVSTLETEIYASVRGSGLYLGNAAWFAIAQLFLAAFPLLLVAGLRPPKEYRDSLAARSYTRPVNAPGKVAIAHVIAATWLVYPGVCFFRATSYAGFANLFPNQELQSAIVVSLEIAFSVIATTLTLGAVFAIGARNSRFVRMLSAVPAGLSPLLVALGFFLAYAKYIDPFEGSVPGMIAVQATLFLPFALRFFLPLLDSESSGPRRDLQNAARTLGASPWSAWRKLEWPRWRRSALRLSALVFVWTLSELAAASFFGSERLTTLGVLLVRWMAQYRFEDVNAILFCLYILSSGVLLSVGLRESSAGGEA